MHPALKALYPDLAALGLVVAARPAAVGGQQLPRIVHAFATAYLMAGNLSAYGYVGLAAGAAHLLETFGSDELKAHVHGADLRRPLDRHDGADRAAGRLEPRRRRHDARRPPPTAATGSAGAKIFISGGDHDLTDNIVHMVLARIDGAPAGTKGVSLFCVPKRRVDATGARPTTTSRSPA